jgi:methionyl-tRNA formyltransferase
MDAGDILAREEVPLCGRETTASLSDVVAEKAAALLADLLRRIAETGQLPEGEAQQGEAVYCSQIGRDMGRIDWKNSAVSIDRQIRAFTPWPLCVTRCGDQELYILAGKPYGGNAPAREGEVPVPGTVPGAIPGTVLDSDKNWGILIQTGKGIFAAEKLQFRFKKALDWRAFLNGARDFIGGILE